MSTKRLSEMENIGLWPGLETLTQFDRFSAPRKLRQQTLVVRRDSLMASRDRSSTAFQCSQTRRGVEKRCWSEIGMGKTLEEPFVGPQRGRVVFFTMQTPTPSQPHLFEQISTLLHEIRAVLRLVHNDRELGQGSVVGPGICQILAGPGIVGSGPRQNSSIGQVGFDSIEKNAVRCVAVTLPTPRGGFQVSSHPVGTSLQRVVASVRFLQDIQVGRFEHDTQRELLSGETFHEIAAGSQPFIRNLDSLEFPVCIHFR